METGHRIPPTLLHDLAYLYLELAHGADHSLDASERWAIEAKLREWQPNQNPKLIEHVIREAVLTYMDSPGREMLYHIIEELGEALPDALRVQVLWDLSDIAAADGKVLATEEGFIQRIAREWGIGALEGKPS